VPTLVTTLDNPGLDLRNRPLGIAALVDIFRVVVAGDADGQAEGRDEKGCEMHGEWMLEDGLLWW